MLRSLREAVVRFGVVGPVALFTGLGPLAGAFVLAGTAPLWLEPFLGAGAVRFPIFLVLTAVLAAWCLIPTHASSLVGGMAFGFGLGTLMALVGTALAAALGFVSLRFLLRDRALEALAHHPRAEAVHRELDQGHGLRTMALLALIRLSPVMPFAGTNLLMSTTGIGLLPFLVGSVVGQAPRIVAVVWIGASLTELDLSLPSDQRLLALGVVATAVVLWVLGRAARRGLARLERA
ncbi:MAG: VTT domain-containing protein [Planctomycetota bacterium]|nr:VTT domain-containing protein [Planctomycetota bacterium]